MAGLLGNGWYWVEMNCSLTESERSLRNWAVHKKRNSSSGEREQFERIKIDADAAWAMKRPLYVVSDCPVSPDTVRFCTIWSSLFSKFRRSLRSGTSKKAAVRTRRIYPSYSLLESIIQFIRCSICLNAFLYHNQIRSTWKLFFRLSHWYLSAHFSIKRTLSVALWYNFESLPRNDF